MRNDVVLNRYRIKNVIIMGPDQDVFVCERITRIKKDPNQYIINIFKKNKIINLLLPGMEILEKTEYKYYVEHFLDNNKLYAVFCYTPPFKIKQYIEAQKPSFADRLRTANSFFINALELKQISFTIQYSLLNHDNININSFGIVYFSHIFDFRENIIDVNGSDVVARIGVIVSKIFENHPNIPEPFKEYLDALSNKKFENIENAYKSFRPFLKDFIGDSTFLDIKDAQPSSDIALKSVVKKTPFKKVILNLVIILVSITLLTGLYFGYRFIRSLTKSIQKPTDLPISASILTPTLEQTAVSDDSTSIPPQTNESSPIPSATPALTPETSANPKSETTPNPVIGGEPDVTPAAVPSAEPGSENNSITPTPVPTPDTKVSPAPTIDTEPEYTLYTVQKGEWLKEICRRFYGDPDYYKQVAKYNNIPNPSEINNGQTIKLPKVEILEQIIVD